MNNVLPKEAGVNVDQIRGLVRNLNKANSLLEQVSNCAMPCKSCEETGKIIGTEDACEYCGGYGFNVQGDIREIVLDILKYAELS